MHGRGDVLRSHAALQPAENNLMTTIVHPCVLERVKKIIITLTSSARPIKKNLFCVNQDHLNLVPHSYGVHKLSFDTNIVVIPGSSAKGWSLNSQLQLVSMRNRSFNVSK